MCNKEKMRKKKKETQLLSQAGEQNKTIQSNNSIRRVIKMCETSITQEW